MCGAAHQAVSKNPELDIMHWVMRRVPIWRMTNRRGGDASHSPSISHTKDGRWFITHGMGARDLKNWCRCWEIRHAGGSVAAARCRPEAPPGSRFAGRRRDARAHADVVQRFIRAWTYADMPWRGRRTPACCGRRCASHENALDEHWLKRKSFADVFHPEHGGFAIPPASGSATRRAGRWGDAPLLGRMQRRCWRSGAATQRAGRTARCGGAGLSALHNKPFPLQGVKILDFAWFLASAAHAFLAAWERRASGGVEGQSGYASCGDGTDRRPRGAMRDRPAARREGSRHGRAVQRNKNAQARHLAEHPPSEGAANRQGPRARLRCRGRRVFARVLQRRARL